MFSIIFIDLWFLRVFIMLLVFFIVLSVDKVIIFLGGIIVYNIDIGSMRLFFFVSFLCDGNLFLKEKCDILVMKIF